jgi:hypothetical protein
MADHKRSKRVQLLMPQHLDDVLTALALINNCHKSEMIVSMLCEIQPVLEKRLKALSKIGSLSEFLVK